MFFRLFFGCVALGRLIAPLLRFIPILSPVLKISCVANRESLILERGDMGMLLRRCLATNYCSIG